jgi:glutaredoxin
MIHVVLYSKKECGLCDKAKAIIEELKAEFPLSVTEVDIYKDDALLEKYQIMIPVVEINGEEAAFGIIHKDVIRKRLTSMLHG